VSPAAVNVSVCLSVVLIWACAEGPGRLRGQLAAFRSSRSSSKMLGQRSLGRQTCGGTSRAAGSQRFVV